MPFFLTRDAPIPVFFQDESGMSPCVSVLTDNDTEYLIRLLHILEIL